MKFNPILAAVVFTASTLLPFGISRADEITIDVQADQAVGRASRYLTGACLEDVNHEIYGGIYSQMVFGESFQEPASSAGFEHFKVFGGQWVARDGEVRIDGNDGPKLVSDHAPFKDGAAGVELLFADKKGQNSAFLVRVRDPEIGADKFIGYEIALDARRQTVALARHRNNFEPIEVAPCEVPVGRWISLEVRLAGSVVEILVDGKSMLKHDDRGQSLAAGTVALRPWHNQAAYRKLWVKTGEQIEPLPFVRSESPNEVSGMWRPTHRGAAIGRYSLVKEQPFVGTQSQQMVFESGDGEIGIENQGLNRWGQNFVAGKPYDGFVWVRAERPATLFATMGSRDGLKAYAEQPMHVSAGKDWQRLDFQLKPSAGDSHGRFALKLKQPGSVALGHVFLQPGEWGRFKGLPVRRDVAQGLIDQGVTILRYGGSMVNSAGYKWKNMIGPRDRRPPYSGTWYKYSSNGWGIPDFMTFCEAAGFEYVPAFNMGETAQDMADFIDYAKAPENTEWGRKRAADGHATPFALHYMELGNEERVDNTYAEKFEALAAAIWAKDPKMTLVVGDFAYDQPIKDPFNFTGAASRITTLAAHQRILRFAKRLGGDVRFDVHVWTDRPVASNASLNGMFSFADALSKIAEGAKYKVVVFEYNSGNHAVKRALANAIATNAIERDGRIPIVTSANCLQPDKQNDNGWDQGLLFLNPSQVWLQPPGYVTQMLSRNYLPQVVKCEARGADGKFDVNAKRSEDGKILIVQAANWGDQPVTAQIHLAGFVPNKPQAQVIELSGPFEAANTAEQPTNIVPLKRIWKRRFSGGRASYTFPPSSFTIIRFE